MRIEQGSSRLDQAKKIARYAASQKHVLHPRVIAANTIINGIPDHTFDRVRANILREVGGFRGIHESVRIAGSLKIGGWGDITRRLEIGSGTYINRDVELDLNAIIRIGKNVGVGDKTELLTSGHRLNKKDQGPRFGDLAPKDITIEDNTWIGAMVTVLPGVTIGRGSVINTGAVVFEDVPSNTVVRGNPGMAIGKIENGELEKFQAPIPLFEYGEIIGQEKV